MTDAIRAAFVDDVSTSLDDMEKLQQLKINLKNFLHSHSLPIKGFALTGTRPDESLSPTDNILVGGLYWFPETDMTQLHTPTHQEERLKEDLRMEQNSLLTQQQKKRLQSSTRSSHSPSPTYSAGQLHSTTKVE